MAKDVQIAFRADAEIKKALAVAAARDDRTVSALVLRIVKEWLEKEKPKRGRP